MIEVEVKLPLKDGEADRIRAILEQRGFAQIEEVLEEDRYYTAPFWDMMALDEALRVRMVTDLKTGETASLLTYKGPKMDQVSMTREELECEVESGETVDAIFMALGYRLLAGVKKNRTSYQMAMGGSYMTVCMDLVEGLGTFAELEVILPDSGEKEAALQMIGEELTIWGYSIADTTRVSYLAALLQKENGN